MVKNKAQLKASRGTFQSKEVKQKAKVPSKPKAPSPSPDLEEDSDSEDGGEDDDDDEGVDKEGMERLMKALGKDGLNEFDMAQLGMAEEDEEDEEDSDEEEEEGSGREEENDEDPSSEDDDTEEVEEATKTSGPSGDVETSEEEDEAELDDDAEADEDQSPIPKPSSNPIALRRIRQTFELDPSLPWTETLVITYPETLKDVNPNDDLNREVAFYKQALHCAQEAKKLATKHSLPFTRPSDYFAEMVKSDIHMERIRSRLLDEAQTLKRSEEAKRQRDLKKYGKQVQVERIKERSKAKKDMLDKVQSLKRKRSGGVNDLKGDDFDIEVDETLDDRPFKRSASNNRGGRGGQGGKPKMPRSARDQKYKWGTGGGKYSKSNTRESTNDFAFGGGRGRGGIGRGGKAGGGRGGRGGARPAQKRLGKSRRQR